MNAEERAAEAVKSYEQALNAVADAIREGRDFLLAAPSNVDADALGSVLALGAGIEKLDKSVTFFCGERIPRPLQPLPHADRLVQSLPDGGRFNASIIADCGSLSLLDPLLVDYPGRGVLINIDHHRTNEDFADITLCDPQAAAAGIVVYRLLRYLGVAIDGAIAENLFAAIVADTGSFRYASVTPETFEIAADLVRLGAQPAVVSERLYDSNTPAGITLLARALATLESHAGGTIAAIEVTREMLKETGASPDDLENMVNHPRSIEGVRIAALFRELESDEIKVSLRSNGMTDVSGIAMRFGGGGHRNAAGCRIRGPLAKVKGLVYEECRKVLRLGA